MEKPQRAIDLGKPWTDPALPADQRAYALDMHATLEGMLKQAIRMAMDHFASLCVPDDIFARVAIISLVEQASQQAAMYLASREADEEQVEAVAQAYAGLLLVRIPKDFPEWQTRFARMVAAEAEEAPKH